MKGTYRKQHKWVILDFMETGAKMWRIIYGMAGERAAQVEVPHCFFICLFLNMRAHSSEKHISWFSCGFTDSLSSGQAVLFLTYQMLLLLQRW